MPTPRFARLLAFVRPYRAHLTGLVFLTVVLSVISMLPPLVTRAIIDRFITQRQHTVFKALAICMLSLPILTALIGYVQNVTVAYVGQRFVFDVRCALYQHLLRLSMRFYGKHSVGMLVNRLMGDTGTVQTLVTAQSISIVSDLVCSAFAITATFVLNWRLAFVLVFIIAAFVINYQFSIERIRSATRRYRGAVDRLSGGVENRLVGNVAVKTFGTELREQGIFRAQSNTSMDLVREALYANNAFSMNTALIQGLGRVTIYYLGCAMVLRGSLSYGDVVAFTSYAMQLLWPAVRFSQLARQIQDVGVSVDRLLEVLDAPPEIQNQPKAQTVQRLRGQVDFEHVHFHYDSGNPVLIDLDLHIAPGETIALIGPTGCGKSTVLSLLLRFFDVCKGSLKLDGIDIRDIDLRSLRRQFGIVLQEPLLFSVSIADNIRYSRPSATPDEIEQAARIAEIHDFIASLPEGYDSMIGSKGVQLSVGQKQRLTIARAVVADPAMLIMDEATSALDSESERAIQIAMERVLHGRTCFVVAHRLSTIRTADRIVLLQDGRIAEMGNHDQLMQIQDGQYRDLYLQHMGAGVIEG